MFMYAVKIKLQLVFEIKRSHDILLRQIIVLAQLKVHVNTLTDCLRTSPGLLYIRLIALIACWKSL